MFYCFHGSSHCGVHVVVFPICKASGKKQALGRQSFFQRGNHLPCVLILYRVGVFVVSMRDIGGMQRNMREVLHDLVFAHVVSELYSGCNPVSKSMLIRTRNLFTVIRRGKIACTDNTMWAIGLIRQIDPSLPLKSGSTSRVYLLPRPITPPILRPLFS